MAERSSEPDDDLPAEGDSPNPSLFERWWWQSFMVAAIGLVVIGFQWQVISTGEAILANWLMVGLGAAAVVVGAVLFRKDRPQDPGDDV